MFYHLRNYFNISHNAKTKQNGTEVKAVRVKARWNHLKDDPAVSDSQQLHQFQCPEKIITQSTAPKRV